MTDLEMKVCGYCGRQNDNDAAHCGECSNQLPAESPASAPIDTTDELLAKDSALLKLEELPCAFNFEEGFSRPDWKLIARKIEALPDRESRRLAWDQAVAQWIAKLARELGG